MASDPSSTKGPGPIPPVETVQNVVPGKNIGPQEGDKPPAKSK